MIKKFDNLLTDKNHICLCDLPIEDIIQQIIDRKEAYVLNTGTLAYISSSESTGRSPKDTVTVKRKDNAEMLDWDSPVNIPITEDTFDMIADDAYAELSSRNKLFASHRQVGADPMYAMDVTILSTDASPILFSYNMFRNPIDNSKSLLKNPFLLLVLPYTKLNSNRYNGLLRIDPKTNKTSDMVIAIDYERHIGIVYGSSYFGSIKKLIFTVMNFYLIHHNILPLHCSANEDENGNTALFLGLSGTGKTTLSATFDRKLIGDDEHGWSSNGIANFENGCYAKLVNLNPEKEPEIYKACFHKDNPLKHGSMVENVVIYPNGSFDTSDTRLTENTRGSYPLKYTPNSKHNSMGNIPTTIIFLTADANGVIPPISKLDINQTLFWYLLGYTSKLAGTETNIKVPVATFSRFFGAPFMPAQPHLYLDMFENKLKEHTTSVYLINTGWIGGAYGVGKRIDLNYTRAMVRAALKHELGSVDYIYDGLFHLYIPLFCPGIDSTLLNPSNAWESKEAYLQQAKNLANDIKTYFFQTYSGKGISDKVFAVCPGN